MPKTFFAVGAPPGSVAMSSNLVIVLAVAAVAPFLVAVTRRLRLPGPVVEMLAGVVIGPSALGWARQDDVVHALSVLGLSFLLFLSGLEVDVRRFWGRDGGKVALSLLISVLLSIAAAFAFDAVVGKGGSLIGIALLATSLGLIVPVLADASVLRAPVGTLSVACASTGQLAAVVALSLGVAGSGASLSGRLVLLSLLLALLVAIAAAVFGAQHAPRLTKLVARLADTSAQIRIRLTVLLVAGIALIAAHLGFESILGAFLAGVLVRVVDPEPTIKHPNYPIKLEAIGFGLLIPVFFIASGITLDIRGLLENPAALSSVPAMLAALLAVRGVPVIVFRRDLPRRHLVASALLQATSLPFLLTAAQVGLQMGLLSRSTAAALTAAGLCSVVIFPPLALRLLSSAPTIAKPQTGDADVEICRW